MILAQQVPAGSTQTMVFSPWGHTGASLSWGTKKHLAWKDPFWVRGRRMEKIPSPFSFMGRSHQASPSLISFFSTRRMISLRIASAFPRLVLTKARPGLSGETESVKMTTSPQNKTWAVPGDGLWVSRDISLFSVTIILP